MNKNLARTIEALLFTAGSDMSLETLATTLKESKQAIDSAIAQLEARYNDECGVVLIRTGNKIRLATNPALGDELSEFLHAEMVSELTRPQLETLTIIAYRGPISKPEIEMIRGVNCTLILRNLMMRGLVEEVQGDLATAFQITTDFLKFLGVRSAKELPEFDELSSPDLLDRLAELNSARTQSSEQTTPEL